MTGPHVLFTFLALGIAIAHAFAVESGNPGADETGSNGDQLPASKKRLEIARLYGGIHEFAYYFVDILVGTPPQRQSVIVDTGSSLLGFPCKRCTYCGSHIDSPFDFSASNTAKWLSCSDSTCATGCGVENRCRYSQRYSEGSSISGHYFADVVALGDIERQNAFVWFNHVGCHSKETNLFTTQKANGIMGVSFPRRGSRSTIIDALFGASDVDTRVFALCIGDHGGIMTVGGYNSSLHRPSEFTYTSPAMASAAEKQRMLFDVVGESSRRIDYSDGVATTTTAAAVNSSTVNRVLVGSEASPIAWTKVTSTDSYSVGLRTITMNGKNVGGEKFGSTIVDSGTTFSYFSKGVFANLMAILKKECDKSKVCRSRSKNDFCWKIPARKASAELAKIPSFVVTFHDGASVEWKAESYLYNAGDSDWCPAFEANYDRTTILGASFMKHKEVVFDRERDLIGFSCAACPLYRASGRPPPPSRADDNAVEGAVPLPPPPQSISGGGLIATHQSTKSWPFLKSGHSLTVSRPGALWVAVGIVLSIVVAAMGVIACQTLKKRPYNYTYMSENTADDDDEAAPIELDDLDEEDVDDDGDDENDYERFARIDDDNDLANSDDDNDMSSSAAVAMSVGVPSRKGLGAAFSTSSSTTVATSASRFGSQSQRPLPPPYAGGGAAGLVTIPMRTVAPDLISLSAPPDLLSPPPLLSPMVPSSSSSSHSSSLATADRYGRATVRDLQAN